MVVFPLFPMGKFTYATAMTQIILHYAPDNASAIIRLALARARLPYATRLVDRSAQAQRTPAYLALNPMGQIPALETPDGVICETAAILLWIAQAAPASGLMPEHSASHAAAQKWLVYLSNTLHVDLRQSFYPHLYIDAAHCDALQRHARHRVIEHFTLFETHAMGQIDPAHDALAVGLYAGFLYRWAQLYPEPKVIDLSGCHRVTAALSTLETCDWLQDALFEEGMSGPIFTDPHPPTPPYGSAT